MSEADTLVEIRPGEAEFVTCPACGHVSAPPKEPGPKASESIIRCDECLTRIAYGVPMPRVVVSPDETDRRFVILTFQTVANGSKTSVTHRVDKAYGLSIWMNVQSICR